MPQVRPRGAGRCAQVHSRLVRPSHAGHSNQYCNTSGQGCDRSSSSNAGWSKSAGFSAFATQTTNRVGCDGGDASLLLAADTKRPALGLAFLLRQACRLRGFTSRQAETHEAETEQRERAGFGHRGRHERCRPAGARGIQTNRFCVNAVVISISLKTQLVSLKPLFHQAPNAGPSPTMQSRPQSRDSRGRNRSPSSPLSRRFLPRPC